MPFKPCPIHIWRQFLQRIGCKCIGTNKHEKWMKDGLLRPVMFSPATKEIPAMVIKSNLTTLSMTWQDFENVVASL